MSSSAYFVGLQDDIISACSEHDTKIPGRTRRRGFERALRAAGSSLLLPARTNGLHRDGPHSTCSGLARSPWLRRRFSRCVMCEFLTKSSSGPRAGVTPVTRSSRALRRLGSITASRLWSATLIKSVCLAPPLLTLTFSFPQAVEIVRQRQSKNIPDVSIADEPLVLTQSNMNHHSFGVGTAERPVILDPGQIGWLPESLGLFTLFKTTGFARAVAGHLFTPEEAAVLRSQPDLNSMARVRALLSTAARPSLSMFTHSF